MSYEVERPLNRCPSHPGEQIVDIMEDLGYTREEMAKDLASMIRCEKRAIEAILEERVGIGPDMAIRFGKLFNTDPAWWLRMQNAYDLYHASHNINVDIIPTLKMD